MGCISSEPHAMQGFAATPLGAMQYRCVATPDFVRRYFGEGLSVPAISTAPAVLFDRKDSLHDAYLEKLLQLKVSQYLRHFIPSPVSLLDTILASAGYNWYHATRRVPCWRPEDWWKSRRSPTWACRYIGITGS